MFCFHQRNNRLFLYFAIIAMISAYPTTDFAQDTLGAPKDKKDKISSKDANADVVQRYYFAEIKKWSETSKNRFESKEIGDKIVLIPSTDVTLRESPLGFGGFTKGRIVGTAGQGSQWALVDGEVYSLLNGESVWVKVKKIDSYVWSPTTGTQNNNNSTKNETVGWAYLGRDKSENFKFEKLASDIGG